MIFKPLKQIGISYVLLAFMFGFLIKNARGAVVEHSFNISYILGSPDGVTKQILVVNGVFPGPTIIATVGDTVIVNVYNNIQDGQDTAIHWHGITQRGSPFQDGTAMIAQCPLKFGEKQVYKFLVDEPGTFWWHAHAKSQYTDGLWGALIVNQEKGKEIYPYDDELLITLSDWNHRLSGPLETWYLSKASHGAPPFPDSALMNGFGRANCSLISQRFHYHCSKLTQLRPVFSVVAGKTYRVRVINASGYSCFRFQIDGHRLRVIEVDGSSVKTSALLDGAIIAPAQRYSFLVKMDAAPTTSGNEFLIRADVMTEILILDGHNINSCHGQMMANVTGVLNYGNETQISVESFDFDQPIPEPPHSSQSNNKWINNDLLEPLDIQPPAPEHVDQEFILNVSFVYDSAGLRRGSLNDILFQLPTDKPIIYSAIYNESIPYTKHHPLYLNYMSVVQIVINNPFRGLHPFHIHGHSFWVLGQGGVRDGDFDPGKHRHLLRLNTIKRDTVLVYQNSWVVLRFIADNPGVWALHCHIDWHNLSGMAAVLVEAPEELARRYTSIPTESLRVCRSHNITL